MYRLPFELTDSAKLLHYTILGGSADPSPPKCRHWLTGCLTGARGVRVSRGVHRGGRYEGRRLRLRPPSRRLPAQRMEHPRFYNRRRRVNQSFLQALVSVVRYTL